MLTPAKRRTEDGPESRLEHRVSRQVGLKDPKHTSPGQIAAPPWAEFNNNPSSLKWAK